MANDRRMALVLPLRPGTQGLASGASPHAYRRNLFYTTIEPGEMDSCNIPVGLCRICRQSSICQIHQQFTHLPGRVVVVPGLGDGDAALQDRALRSAD